jgi:TonB family protein
LRGCGFPRGKSKEANVSEERTHGATTIYASKGGGGSKWLLGAVAAVALAGGAYAAWQMFGPSQDRTELAYNDPYADPYGEEPLRAGPLEPAQDPIAEGAATDEHVAAPASSEPRSAAPARRVEAVPEATIGVTPANATAEATAEATPEATLEESDEVIVTAPRRPIWASAPSPRRLSAMYPERALERGREGEARLHCTVLDGGALDCVRVEETSYSFGNAALRVARTLRHAPTLADGSEAAGTPVNLHVVFRIEDEEQRFASR